ncbi:oligosaccharide flippase family protein [Vibrio cyclitrophicus]|nr:oligosaccharide flippase family protein [Vibrio cyclitrophicus]
MRAIQNIIFIIIGLVFMPIFYKHLGPIKIGEISYIESWATIFSIFASFGFARYGTRELSKSKVEGRSEIYYNIRRFVITNHFLISVFYFFVAYYLLLPKVDFILLIISVLSVNRNLFNNDWVYEAIDKFNLVSVKNIILKLLLMTVLLIAFLYGVDDFQYYFYILTSGFPFISFLVLYLYFMMEKKSIVGGKNEAKYNGRYYYKSLIPSLLLSNSYLLFFQADKIILGGYSLYEVGLYSFSERIVLLIFPIIMSLVIVGVPKITKSFVCDRVEYQKLIEKMLLQIYFLVVPLSITLFYFSDNIVELLGGEGFENSSDTLRFFSITLFAMAVWRFITSCVYYATSNEWSCFVIIMFFGFVSVLVKSSGLINDASGFITLTLIMHMLVILTLTMYSRLKLGIYFKLFFGRLCYYLTLSLLTLLLVDKATEYFDFSSLSNLIFGSVGFAIMYLLILILTKDKVMYGFINRGNL